MMPLKRQTVRPSETSLACLAGVPGMVGAMLRHLRSLRSFKRDHGWIHTLLEEAENERMHLLTFLSLKQPNVFFRAAVLGAQGTPSGLRECWRAICCQKSSYPAPFRGQWVCSQLD